MLKSQHLASPADVIYLCDGGLAGFYCCVHACVYSRELPAAIVSEAQAQPTIFPQRRIQTDPEKARRVRASVAERICPDALELIENVYLSCLENKELHMLDFLLLAYANGNRVMQLLGHPAVSVLMKAQRHLLSENHLLLGFIRFTDYGGMLAATITPKNFVLPFMAHHFAMRYSKENFMIYDKTHKAALIHENGGRRIVPLDGIQFNEPNEEKQRYRGLWKRFYDTIAIEARTNPKCRMTHMPKRYWVNMPEMQDQL